MEKFLKRLHLNTEHHGVSICSESEDSDANKTKVLTAKKIRTSCTRNYDASYIQFGFVDIDDQGVLKPQCVVCGEVLSNDAMKPSKLKRHLNSKHKDICAKPKEFFERKRADLKSCKKQIFSASHINTGALRASYKVALRIGKAKKAVHNR